MWFQRMVRRWGWGRNPLRRTSDRIEVCVSLLIVGVMVVIGPWAASHAAYAAYRNDVQATAWEMRHRFEVDALLVKNARVDSRDAASAASEELPALAQWIGRDGTVHTGTIFVDQRVRAGTTVRIWIDDHGLVSDPPGRRSPRMDATVAAMLVLCGLAGGLAGVRRVVRWQLDRRRLRAWQLEWMTVGPGWTRQR